MMVIAETGLNHNGDVETAHRMIDAIAAAGADAAKFQCYRTEDFVTNHFLTYKGRSQWEMFKRCELPDEAWPELQSHCNEAGVVFFATPTSVEKLDLLAGLGVPLLKNGSDYLGHLPLIRAMAHTGIKTILSCGMATAGEITEAVNAFEGERGHGELMLMHCTSVYPTEPADVNLRRIPQLRNRFGIPIGFSDHTAGAEVTAAIGATALGAAMIEKHFTLDRGADGPDHAFSADPFNLRVLVNAVRWTEPMLGSVSIGPTDSEQTSRRNFRVTYSPADGLYLRR